MNSEDRNSAIFKIQSLIKVKEYRPTVNDDDGFVFYVPFNIF